MRFVHKVAQRLAVSVLVSGAAAVLSCKSTTGGNEPVASVAITPGSASIQVGQLMMPTAVPKDRGGNPLTGRLMSWSSSNALVATVTSVGLVTGIATGSAAITATSEGQSGMSTITVTAAGSCLDQVGPLTTLTGVSASPYIEENLAADTKIDAKDWQSRLPVALDAAVKIGGSAGACWSGGEMLGAWPPNTIYDVMHSKYPMVVGGSGGAQNIRVENVRVFNYGQGIGFDNQEDRYWRLTGCYIKYDRQAIENDFLNSGNIDDCFVEDAQTFLSSRAYTTTEDGSNNVVIISNSLVSLGAHDAAYLSGLPSHNALFKWSGSGLTPGIGPRVAIYRTIFRLDSDSREQEGAGEYITPPPGKLADCEDNIMVWLGPGAYPEPLPTTFNGKPCFKIVTTRAPWDSAVADWKARHPRTLPDIAPPIVSLFQPGLIGSTTLTGTVTLIATAVDDGDVGSVQFKLDGADIGAQQTTNTEYRPTEPKYWDLRTKYSISWDSRSVPNGTHTLTVTAQDVVGNTATAAEITVTINN